MNGRSSASDGSTDARAGERRARTARRRRAARGSRAPRASGSSGRRSFSACCSRSRSCSSRLSASSVPRRTGSSRSETTPTTREASSTCTVSRPYAGAIRTAVCWRDVVAPPIRSGSSSPRRSISLATCTISSRDGVIRPGEADRVGALLDGRVEDRVARDHHAEVDHLVVVAAEHDADDVLADVVHVALDGGEHDRALARGRCCRSAPSPPPCTAPGRRPRASSPARS